MADDRVNLLSNATATGSGREWGGGAGTFCVVGTFSGATVALQMLGPDATTWVTLNNGAAVSLTAAGALRFDAPPGQLRASVASGSPSGLYASVYRLP